MFTEVKGTTEFWVRVKSAPGAMFAITGLVIVGEALKTAKPVPVSSEREVSSCDEVIESVAVP